MASIKGYLKGNIREYNIKALTDVLIIKITNYTQIVDKELVELLVNEYKVLYNIEPDNNEYIGYLIESIITSEYCKIYKYNFANLIKKSNLSRVVYRILLEKIEEKKSWEGEEMFFLEEILDDEIIHDYSQKFMEGVLHNLKFTENIISRHSQFFSAITGLSNKYKSIFKKKLSVIKIIDYDSERKKDNQLLFNTFFDKLQFEFYLEELLTIIDNKTIKLTQQILKLKKKPQHRVIC